jgi:hypothetical protein
MSRTVKNYEIHHVLGAFARLLKEARLGSAAQKKARRLDSAERTIRSLLAMGQYEQALAEAGSVLAKCPGEQGLRAPRVLAVAGMEEKGGGGRGSGAADCGPGKERMRIGSWWTRRAKRSGNASRAKPG